MSLESTDEILHQCAQFGQYMLSAERAYVHAALSATGWNVSQAARACGVTYRAMRYAAEKVGLRDVRRPMSQVPAQERAFLAAWPALRAAAFAVHGRRCACCASTAADGVRLSVDHIHPRSKRPDLALDLANLQVLCDRCNSAKGDKIPDHPVD